MRRSKNHPSAPAPAPPQFYQPTAPYGRRTFIDGTCGFEQTSLHLAQPANGNSFTADFSMPNPAPAPAPTGFFSPQAAFYAPNAQPTAGPNTALPGMEFLSNNPLLSVGFNVVEQGMRDFTGKTAGMLPNEVSGISKR
jgi:hypothetical protein